MILTSFFKTVRSRMSSTLLDTTRLLSVEPVVLCHFVTMVFSSCLGTSLLVYKACDPTGSTNGWQRVSTACPDEAAAQHVVAPINAWKSLVQQLVPIAIAMVAGTWSDRAGQGRRPLIALPVAGQIAADVLSLCCVIRWSVSPAVTAAVQTAALSLTGGSPLIFTGINTYAADTTPEQWRTIKYGLVNSTITLGCILGMVVYGAVSANTGFVTAYLISIGLGLVTMALTFVFVKGKNASTAADAVVADPPEKSFCREFVDVVNPVSVFRKCYNVLSKPRPGHGAMILCLAVLVCAPLTCVPVEGEMTLMYLFLRYKFHWNEVDFSIFNIYLMSIISIGTIFALGVLNHALNMDDALIGMIASAFDVLAAIAFFLASQSWHLFYICPLEIFRGAALALTSSIASKNVKPDELGAMYSMKLLTESTMKGAFTPLYNYVYNYTLETMPSTFFLISVVLTVPLVVIFGIIYYLNRSSDLNSQHQT